MADLQYTVQLETTQVNRNLDNLNTKVDKLTNKFAGLQSAIAGLAIGAAITNAIRFADAIVDLSDATGIAVENITGFSRAVELNGGSAQDATTGILKLVQTIGQAAEGSLDAQFAFRQVGVSLDDLRTLSEQDLLIKTIQGLGRIDDVGKRAVLTTELLGKSFRSINVQGVANGLAGATIASTQYSNSIKQAAELQDKLDRAIQQVQLSLLKAIDPLLTFMNKLDNDKVAKMIDATIQLAAQVGAAAVAFAALSKILNVIGVAFVTIGGLWAAGSANIAAGVAGISAGFASLQRTLSIAINYITRFFKATPMFAQSNGLLANMVTLLEKLGLRFSYLATGTAVAAGGAVAFSTGVGQVALAFAGLSAATYGLASVFDMIFNTKIVDNFTAGVGRLYNKTKEILGFGEKAPKMFEQADIRRIDNATVAVEKQAVVVNKVTDGISKQKQELLGVVDAFAKQNAQVRNNMLLEAALQGMNLRTQETIRAQTDIYARMQSEIDKLLDKKDKLSEKEQDLIPVINEQIKKLRERADIDSQAAATAVNNAQSIVNANKLVVFGLEQQNQLQNQVADIQDQIAMVTLPELEKRYYAVEAAARSAARSQIQAEEARRGTKLSPEEAKQYYDAASKGTGELKNKQGELLAQQEKMNVRQFQIQSEKRLTEQLTTLNDDLAKLTLTSIEKKYYDIESAAKAAARAEIQTAEARLGRKLSPEEAKQYYDAASAGTDKLKEKTKELYEQSRTFSTGWKQAFNEYVENATNAADQARQSFNAFTSNLESSIDNWVDTGKFKFSDFATSVIKDLLKIQMKAATMELFKYMGGGGGGFLGSIGSLLGFAEGGNPPIGRASIVGENGPELIVPRTASTVIPNHQLGGGVTNNTYVTNNISAVDAKSVAQLFAENRRLLLGNVEQAKKEMPYGMA